MELEPRLLFILVTFLVLASVHLYSMAPALGGANQIIVVTPTYERALRVPHMTSLMNTLAHHRKNVFWIVIEDANTTSPVVEELLASSKINYHYISQRTTCLKDTSCPFAHHKGIDQRNAALSFLEQNNIRGLVYFADDDNIYDTRIFSMMADIQSVGVFAVGLIGTKGYEAPVVTNSFVSSFDSVFDHWPSGKERKFKTDMAGFAFRSDILLRTPGAHRFQWESQRGFLESDFLSTMVKDIRDLEFVREACERVYVWHMPKPQHVPSQYPQSWRLTQQLHTEISRTMIY